MTPTAATGVVASRLAAALPATQPPVAAVNDEDLHLAGLRPQLDSRNFPWSLDTQDTPVQVCVTHPQRLRHFHHQPRRAAVLTLAVGGLGIYLSCLQFEANKLDHARNELDHARNQLEHDRKLPSVHVYAETWDVVKHTEVVYIAELVEELEDLENEYRRYSGRSILDVTYSLLDRQFNDGDETLEPAEARDSLAEIRQSIENVRRERLENLPSLVEALDALLASWRRETAITPTMVAELSDLERRYSAYTGSYIVRLQEALPASAGGGTAETAVGIDEAVSRLEYVSAAIRDDLAFDEPGFDALLADLDGLVQTHVEGKEGGQRLVVETVVENQSQLATMIRRKARVKLFYEAGTLQKNVEAESDLNLDPYSVGAVMFSSEDLDASEVAIIAKHRDEIRCALAVLDLRQEPWRGECRTGDVSELENLLKQELNGTAVE